MYRALVLLLLGVLPVASIALEALHGGAPFEAVLVAKWFVFWAIGCRLGLAGARQIVDPGYTARLLGLASADALFVVRELGFANLALGTAGLLSLAAPGARAVLACAGGLFYLLAGLGHVGRKPADSRERWAMVSDLAVGIVLLGSAVAGLLAP